MNVTRFAKSRRQEIEQMGAAMRMRLTHDGIRDTLREEVGLIPPVISLKFCGKRFAELRLGAIT